MDIDPQTLLRARVAVNEAVQQWIYDPNVVMIGFGWRERQNEYLRDELTIRVHIKEKFSRGPELQAAIREGITRAAIPDTIRGFPVDRPVGTYRLQQFLSGWWWRPRSNRARRADPMKGGISISDAYRNIYATLGGLVRDRQTRKDMILSNWHVLAGSWSAQHGQPIIQPGRGDGGSEADSVAKLSRHAMSSGLDAAVAELTGRRTLINDQFDLKPVKGAGHPMIGMQVVKSGRRTEITYGEVIEIGSTIRMTYRGGVERLINHVATIIPRPPSNIVSDGGDSGSLWCEESTMNAVALHFAGTDNPVQALAMDLQTVLDALDVNLVT